jgi:hypothetical protein
MASSREEEYLKALDIAKSTFLSHDSEERCRIAGADWESHALGSIVRLPFFKDLCRITLPDFAFSLQENQAPITLANQILILHYLNGVKDIALAEKTISFKEVPAGEFYHPAFARRSVKPLLQTFAQQLAAFKSIAVRLGGQPIDIGDCGIRISVFPKVPVTLLYWSENEEFPPDLKILFDATIPEFFSTEDIAVTAQEVMIRMIKLYYSHHKN